MLELIFWLLATMCLCILSMASLSYMQSLSLHQYLSATSIGLHIISHKTRMPAYNEERRDSESWYLLVISHCPEASSMNSIAMACWKHTWSTHLEVIVSKVKCHLSGCRIHIESKTFCSQLEVPIGLDLHNRNMSVPTYHDSQWPLTFCTSYSYILEFCRVWGLGL